MRLVLLMLGLMTLGACRAAHSPPARGQAASREAVSREWESTDSLVRAALTHDGVRLEYRWVLRTASSQPQEGRAVFDPVVRQWLILSDTVVLDMSAVDRVEISHGSGTSGVTLHLNATSAERLRANTTGHLGSQLAELLNGQLITAPAPTIRSSFSDHMPVVVDVDSTVARELEARLRRALGDSRQAKDTTQ